MLSLNRQHETRTDKDECTRRTTHAFNKMTTNLQQVARNGSLATTDEELLGSWELGGQSGVHRSDVHGVAFAEDVALELERSRHAAIFYCPFVHLQMHVAHKFQRSELGFSRELFEIFQNSIA